MWVTSRNSPPRPATHSMTLGSSSSVSLERTSSAPIGTRWPLPSFCLLKCIGCTVDVIGLALAHAGAEKSRVGCIHRDADHIRPCVKKRTGPFIVQKSPVGLKADGCTFRRWRLSGRISSSPGCSSGSPMPLRIRVSRVENAGMSPANVASKENHRRSPGLTA